MLRKFLIFFVAAITKLFGGLSLGAEPDQKSFRGVVTYYLIPAKVMRVNEIIEEPKTGTSYIGEEGILVELQQNVDVQANWTVVIIEYDKYQKPQTLSYEMFEKQREITVEYYATNVTVDGDISEYITQ